MKRIWLIMAVVQISTLTLVGLLLAWYIGSGHDATAPHQAPQTVGVTAFPPPAPEMSSETTAGEIPPPETFDDLDLDLNPDSAPPAPSAPAFAPAR